MNPLANWAPKNILASWQVILGMESRPFFGVGGVLMGEGVGIQKDH